MKAVTFLEFTAFDQIVPLASAYLQSYASADPEIAENFSFYIRDVPVPSADVDALIIELERSDADVFAISCYLWNMGIVKSLLSRLTAKRPDAHIILGGPQVMNHAEKYVPDRNPNVVVCNGEGERTFLAYLRQILTGQPDFAAVPGISFWRDDELVTTERPERIRDLMEVPSPYLSGLFKPGKYSFAVLETNRGCPYNCSFCFWGAATNAKVNRFETQRVLDDITWLSENGFTTIFLADANWGMAPRDVEFTEHIVECKRRTGYPHVVSMNAAKNKPDRVAEITRILVRGGLLTSQPISLQSMDTNVLDLIDRSNIRTETYTSLQRTLRKEGISSYIEMIWPLPGETVRTFRDGLTSLCRSSADTILVYPQLLLHNTPIYENRVSLGVRTRRVPEPAAEADVVVSTNWVTEEDYNEGVWIYYAANTLYNFRGLYYLANYLNNNGRLSFGELFSAAVEFYKSRTDSEICRFLQDSVEGLGNYYLLNSGRLAHQILHARRAEFNRLLVEFAEGHDFWRDDMCQAALEMDLLARPYIYRERAALPDYEFRQLQVIAQDERQMTVRLPEPLSELLGDLDVPGAFQTQTFRLRHPRGRKIPALANRPLEESVAYCQAMALHMREMLPTWTPVSEQGTAA